MHERNGAGKGSGRTGPAGLAQGVKEGRLQGWHRGRTLERVTWCPAGWGDVRPRPQSRSARCPRAEEGVGSRGPSTPVLQGQKNSCCDLVKPNFLSICGTVNINYRRCLRQFHKSWAQCPAHLTSKPVWRVSHCTASGCNHRSDGCCSTRSSPRAQAAGHSFLATAFCSLRGAALREHQGSVLILSASSVALVVKNPPANARDIRDVGSIPGWGRSPGGGHGNLLQCSCLENPMDRGAWRATVHRVAKSETWLKRLSMHARAFLVGDRTLGTSTKGDSAESPAVTVWFISWAGGDRAGDESWFIPGSVSFLVKTHSVQFSHSVVSNSLRPHEP